MKKLLILSSLVLALGSFTFDASAAKSKEVFKFQNEFNEGVKAIKSEKFDKAFKHLDASSKLGNKSAQYELALLYARGLGTKRDFSQAYLWLNVATEVQERRWEELEMKISGLFTKEQLAQFKPHVTEYIDKYGKKSQEVVCERQANMGSNVKYMFCEKLLDSGQQRIRTQ